MKIQKFGTIKYSPESNLPIFQGFTFELSNERENELCQTQRGKMILMLSAIRDNLSEVIEHGIRLVEKESQDASGNFSIPLDGNTKSPEEIVAESLSRIMGKYYWAFFHKERYV